MRYIPVAAPTYIERYLPGGFTAEAVATAPSLAWNRDDALQDMLVRKACRRAITRPVHFVPTAEGFGAAVRAGLGWGMYPEQSVAPALADGSFVRISDAYLDVPLFWQFGSWTARWCKRSPMWWVRRPQVSDGAGSSRSGTLHTRSPGPANVGVDYLCAPA
jgi:DNA-binding transcriptional LysR family regulator